ncbi:MAG: hypothetical protein ACTMHL_05490 [Janibacter sp.]
MIEAPQTTRSPGRSPALWWALFAGFILLSLVAICGVVALGSSGDQEASSGEAASEVVTDYMDALVEGDASSAIDLVQTSGRESVLSERAYEQALESAPVDDVVVKETRLDDEMSGTVGVTFTVGGESAQESISVHDYDRDGQWEMIPPTAQMEPPTPLQGLGVKLNGEEIDDDDVLLLLPGTYEVGVDSPHYALSGTSSMEVTTSSGAPSWPEPSLSSSGTAAFREAVREEVDSCMEQKTLKAGCGLGTVPDTDRQQGWKMVDGTVKRSLTSGTEKKLKTMKPDAGSSDPTSVEGPVVGGVDTTMSCTKDGQTGECELFINAVVGAPTVDMTVKEPTVDWSDG